MLKKTSNLAKFIFFCVRVFSFFYGALFCFCNKKKKLKKILLKNRLKSFFLYKRKNKDFYNFDYKNIPIFIISFNNLSYVKQIITSLEKFDLTNIHIVDNNSDYPPLLDFLKQTKYQVHMMKINWGHKVIWDSHCFDEIIYNSPYVVSDPDIELSSNLPLNFMEILLNILNQFDLVTKIGFALKIDDLADFLNSNKVKTWESQFWQYRIPDNKYELYKADVDTTFALYRPGNLSENNFYTAIRIAGEFSARHLPWYMRSEEQDYYEKTSSSKSASWSKDVSRYTL